MIRENFTFIKNEHGEWFINLPEYPGPKEDLQMVAGADTFLEIISNEKDEVNVKFTNNEFKGAEQLYFTELGRVEGFEMGTGAWYEIKSYEGVDNEFRMWLCDVTKFVFNEFPRVIYFQML